MSVALRYLDSAADDAIRLAARLGVPPHPITQHRFPDGEIAVNVGPAAATTILYLPLDQPNDKLVTILFAAEALRREGCHRLVLLAPYLCYMRQDVAFHPGDAISQKAMGRLLAGLGDRVITVHPPPHR
ncbi:ribose-phosphate pyrophosphokinase-like domain-containing protein, partial [Rhodopseudomonas sp. BR0C11]|uniref:ribose-phosphate pyrophosphokinase-like domain-containing protein n=1 Tax=Rhodopseudomonas sp. BR0C11 TaxID=2269370 RepID=UPI0013DE946B|nr:ribose-phosphate pyrophosphokinase-like domain-containing protein [Rhodopseudomonas sp. BR0C11]